ncbi:Octicosapeptide/Phox/Bem1p and tetratricopeptide repeat domain-containingprotein [Zostera marina]|uniref:Octicosapeptide/Phox/Bem1p and tetratricopeptide repeat domain-containingprotein n=2 Tax=Zostera marina TaxID=29655 RepID=A0A0K9PYW5_ZOSMR|nr:Octicosapeptide/Phox/Bem1p and tetratricopeptide repeat domain-containingprotein [Zostera marina]
MGKPSGKKKKLAQTKSSDALQKSNKTGHNPKIFDRDTTAFIDLSNELKEEGNKQFQKREYEAAILTYEKAVDFLPKKHIDIAYLRSNIATCYMQMNPGDFNRAIKECNLALEVSPKYSKALLKRARCFEALDKLEWAFKDVNLVLQSEPNNVTALDICERLKLALEDEGIDVNALLQVPIVEPEKPRKKRNKKSVDNKVLAMQNTDVMMNQDKEKEDVPKKSVKLVLGEDIRLAQVPLNCSVLNMREIVGLRFPETEAVLIKYKDIEGDLVTITSTDDLRWAEECADLQGSFRLYLVEVNPEKDPLLLEKTRKNIESHASDKTSNGVIKNGSVGKGIEESGVTYIDTWIVEFARLFRDHVGFDPDEYMDLHELGMKLYSESLEDVVTSEEAQEYFDAAEHRFQEMSSLALFHWGNVHMSRARKRLYQLENSTPESIMIQVKSLYDWAHREYVKAGKRYEEAIKIKPDFYEGILALGQQQFEQAKLTWYHAIGNKVNLLTWSSSEVLNLFSNAEDNMERGMEIWEETEEYRLKNLSKPNKEKETLRKLGIENLFKEISNDQAAEQAFDMRSQSNILFGTMLYERSVVEFTLQIPIWQDSLADSIERFKLAGASPSDIAVMLKNHCSGEAAQEGLGFKVDEIVQAWNEMFDAKRWRSDVPSFRLEPILRRRVPKFYRMLEIM